MDFPLAMPRVKPMPKEAPTKLIEGKKEEWTTVGRKGKPLDWEKKGIKILQQWAD